MEYNPFHNGHIRHIEEARKKTNCDLLIAITSGNFSQRGDVSVLDKFDKTKIALEYGVDLVIELPFIYTLQNARVFGEKAVYLLKALGINYLVFGSETCNLDELKKYADYNIDITHLKEIMSLGTSFPKAYGLLASALYPNDILGVSYLKALKDSDVEPILIKRTSNYHDLSLDHICSASAIRNSLKNGEDYSKGTPISIISPHFIDELYPYLRRLLFTMDKKELQKIFLVSEGIENMLIKNAYKYNSYTDFLNASISKRYTKSRIQRVIMHIILQIKKEDVKNLPDLDFARVLGFNSNGRQFLREYDSKNLNVITQFKNIPQQYKDIEWKASLIYATLFENPSDYLLKELKGPIISK